MCGICGILSLDGRPDSDIDSMLAALRHRGPDGAASVVAGPLTLGHTRLAIRGGHEGDQPLHVGDHYLSYNGELYNCEELLARMGLGDQPSTNDSVVLARWLAAGGSLEALNGMFALAWWRADRRELVLARDRFGIKPLYYLARPDFVAFASELRALAGVRGWRPRPDLAMVWQYLVAMPPVGERTMWAEVRAVPPGAMVTIRANTGATTISSFCSELPGERAIAAPVELGTTLREVVGRQLVSDRPMGLTISGGVDSMVLAATVVGLGASLPTFTADWSEAGDAEVAFLHGRDAEFAALGADALDLPHVPVAVAAEFDEARVRRVIARKHLPLSHTTELAIDRLFEVISGRCRSVLTGEGADELWRGYGFFEHGDPRRLPWAGLDLAALTEVFEPAALAAHEVEARLVELARAHAGLPPQRALFASFLPYLLERLDRLAMAHSVEARVPYLDHALSLAGDDAARGPLPPDKRELRALARTLLPAAIAERRKSAFPPSLGPSTRRSTLALLEARVERASSRLRPWLRAGALDHLRARTDFAGHLLGWRLLNLDLWLAWLEGPHVD